MTEPVVRRRPGRPRKNPLPEPDVEATSTEVVETPKKEAPSDPRDPRIGLECHPDATQVGFEDGSHYAAEDGFLVKRVYA